MKIHYIMHADFETIGVIDEWAKEKGYSVTGTKLYKGEKLPSVNDFDFLIVLGGPQSPLKVDQYPYLLDEINFIKLAISQQKRVLGFCLGAQLISEALGGHTKQSPNKEIGIYPIRLTAEGQKDQLFSGFPEVFDAIHWHNDMPGIPAGAELLATSEGCPIQAVRFSDKVYGFQFHMEITRDGIADLINHCPGDLKPSRFTHTESELRSADLSGIHDRMKLILDRLMV